MHGLIFVTWEKYLTERFGTSFLRAYRSALGETSATSPLASRVYDDELLLMGVEVACRLTYVSAGVLLREYGRYFIINGLTSHLCAYLLNRVNSGKELLFTMRRAHGQLRRVPDGLTPPIFGFELLQADGDKFILVYDSHRKLCPVLLGAIEGAAERFGEEVSVNELACMKQGADACRFEVQFSPSAVKKLPAETAEQRARSVVQRQLADIVFSCLPDKDGISLLELYRIMESKGLNREQLRLSTLLEALRHLQYVGLAASTANQPGDNLTLRRYWRVPATQVL
jgi:hypothetical protein